MKYLEVLYDTIRKYNNTSILLHTSGTPRAASAQHHEHKLKHATYIIPDERAATLRQSVYIYIYIYIYIYGRKSLHIYIK